MPVSPIFLTGATGFVGHHILTELLRRGYTVHALVRKTEGFRTHPQLRVFTGSILEPATLEPAIAGCRSIIHLVGIIDEKHETFERIHIEGTRNVLEAAQIAGTVKRWVHMSALGTRPNAVSRYHQSKWAAEELVRNSIFPYVIFRPSLIHGPRGEFTRMLRDWSIGKIPPFFFMPFFGSGFFGQSNPHLIQPMHVADVVWLFAEALTNPAASNKIYSIAGPDLMSWREMLRIASTHFRGKPKLTLGIPAWKAKLLASLPLPLPFNMDQVIMSQEDNTAALGPVQHDFPLLTLHRFVATLE